MNRSSFQKCAARFRPTLMAVACALVLAGLWSATASAQDRDRVLRALETTDQRIELAAGVVAAVDNPAAETELTIVREIQARAREAFTRDQLEFAMRLTTDALRRADRLIAFLKGLPDPDRVESQLDRTRELIERTRERVEECDLERAQGLVRAAVEMQSRAEEAARTGRHLVALQLTMGARERANRALRLCRMEENLQQAAERALRRTEDLIARVEEQVETAAGGEARQALERAKDLQARAQREFVAGHYEPCLRQTQSARAMAYRAARIAGASRR